MQKEPSDSSTKRKVIAGSAAAALLSLGLAAWGQDSSRSNTNQAASAAAATPSQTRPAETPAAPVPVSSAPTSRVEVIPASIELQSKDVATALLIMRNVGSSPLSGVKVTPVTDSALEVVARPSFADAQTIVAKGDFAWTVEIRNKGDDPVNGSVIFRIEHLLGSGDAGIPQVTYAVLQTKSRDVTQVAEIKLETALESLDQQHPASVYLVITNKSNQSITVKRNEIAWDKPDFVEIPARSVPKPATGATTDQESIILTPQQTVVIGFTVGTAERVQPGKHLLVAKVPFEWGGAGRAQKRIIIVTKEFQVGVLGESALLKVLAIPSFLIIPGFIGVIIWGVLWKWGLFKTKQDRGDFPLQFSEQPTNPQFWVAAITISIPVILIYKWCINRDVLGTYGLSDLIWIWLASVFALGLGGYIAIIGGRRWYLRRRTPSHSDKPIDVLKKLGRQGEDVFRERVAWNVTESGASKKYQGLLLQKKDPERPTTWVGPPIQVVWGGEASQKAKDAVDNLRKRGNDPSELASALEEAGKNVHLKWKEPEADSEYVKEPTEVNTPQITASGGDSIVEI